MISANILALHCHDSLIKFSFNISIYMHFIEDLSPTPWNLCFNYLYLLATAMAGGVKLHLTGSLFSSFSEGCNWIQKPLNCEKIHEIFKKNPV